MSINYPFMPRQVEELNQLYTLLGHYKKKAKEACDIRDYFDGCVSKGTLPKGVTVPELLEKSEAAAKRVKLCTHRLNLLQKRIASLECEVFSTNAKES